MIGRRIDEEEVARYPGPDMLARAEGRFADIMKNGIPHSLAVMTALDANNLAESRYTVDLAPGVPAERIPQANDGLGWLATRSSVVLQPGARISLLGSVKILGDCFTQYFDRPNAIQAFTHKINNLAESERPDGNYTSAYGRTWRDKSAGRDVYMCIIDTALYAERPIEIPPEDNNAYTIAETSWDTVISRVAWMIPAGSADIAAVLGLRAIVETSEQLPQSLPQFDPQSHYRDQSGFGVAADATRALNGATKAALSILEAISAFGPSRTELRTAEQLTALNRWKFWD